MQKLVMSFEQKMVYNLLMCDPKDERIPMMPVSEDVMIVGDLLKQLFKNKTYTQMYLDTRNKIIIS